ncbi:MAG: sigma-70 family RNA polymerase sigma factor [Myxococcales bacterium]|nr:sigma-70 family RNA polymerase sigma factor [Myxococcales bacterium]
MTATDWSVRSPLPTSTEIYREHADFVWITLRRMGIAESDRPDLLQEVFVVVHRRLPSYEPDSKITSWLYGICRRVSAAHRRRAHVRREQIVEEPARGLPETNTPEQDVIRSDARAQLQLLLDSLDADKRVVFLMFELEGRSCQEIAELQGVPVGTVYSRLHAARKAFEQAVGRLRARRNEVR